ncbi:OTU-domain-containing protein [Xylariaceae sp. FL1651]|nr:OTU-domain-containing protein [Xylariaceae sp. FL1651]
METLEAIQARHRKEQRELQSRITSKKKNATKKTRKGIADECAMLERELKDSQERELAVLNGNMNSEEPNSVEQKMTTPPEDRDDTDGNGITDRLKSMKISPTTPTSTQTPPQLQSRTQTSPEPAAHAEAQEQNQGQGQGRKRNRQKERMARRAAEQEAVAEAAEEEAKDMTDYRGIERSSLERAFNAHGLIEYEIRPDGHCLFSAVADQLAQRNIPLSLSPSIDDTGRDGEKTPPYRAVRRVATDYIETHSDNFAPFLEEPLETYVPKIRDTAEWGGQLELLALASAYHVQIKVVQNGRTETIQPSDGGQDQDKRDEDRTIWLAYYRHGYGLGEHYNSLRKKS